MKNRSVLLVDDDEVHQYSLGRHLEHTGYTVLRAQTGAQTLELAQEAPDVILLDINLPDMTGFEICEKLKADAATRDIPVIFHSATHDTTSARSVAKDLGAVSFLNYPIDVEHLESVLRGAVARRHERTTE